MSASGNGIPATRKARGVYLFEAGIHWSADPQGQRGKTYRKSQLSIWLSAMLGANSGKFVVYAGSNSVHIPESTVLRLQEGLQVLRE
jgi:hypothetical protein